MGTVNRHASEEEQRAEVERVWREHWAPILVLPDGVLDLGQLKRELHDADMYWRHCREIYEWASGGQVSNPATFPHVVIAIAEAERGLRDRGGSDDDA